MFFAPDRSRTSVVALTLVRRAWVVVAASALVPVLMLSATQAAAATREQPAVASPIETNVWLATATGKVFAFGSAASYGSVDSALNKPIVGIAPTPDGGGYWLVASDGGVFSFGDAKFYGSTGAMRLNKPVVGMASTSDGKGYWLVASDGGIFCYGDAKFYGSTGARRLNKPVVGMTPMKNGAGYWLVASDGGVFNFGRAPFFGSTGSLPTEPAEKLVPARGDSGYWVVDQNGTAYSFGDTSGAPPATALFFGDLTQGDSAVLFAFQQLGKPYIWGGNGPVGYDCSGLALASWENGAGIGFARVSDDQYLTAGSPVSLVDLESGDLVFWGTDQTNGESVYHTAIYVGGGHIVEAAGSNVHLADLGQWGQTQLMPHGMRP
jgi:cell wall-associated NlpC family hydrolase